MKRFISATLAVVSMLLWGCSDTNTTAAQDDKQRIVTVGAAITETVYALGMDDHIVGRDQTSVWPQAATQLPDVGYPRNLALEGILSLAPDLVIASHDAGPPHVIAGLKNAGVEVLIVTTGPQWEHAKAGIRQIGAQLSAQPHTDKILANADRAIAQALDTTAHTKPPARLLFLLAEGPNGWLAAGKDTRANTLITAVQGENVMAATSGYRPLSAEAILALSPDAILVASHALVDQRSGVQKTLQQALHQAGLESVPAVKNDRSFVLDSSQFLTLGPRFGDAVSALSQLLYPQAVAISK